MSTAAKPVKIEFQISQVANLWRKVHNRNSKQLGMSVSERRVLVAVNLHPGQAQSTIALYLDMEPQNLLRIIDKLEQGGYLERRASNNDRRIKTLHLLEKGEDVINKIYEINDEFRTHLLDGIPAEKITITKDTLDLLEKNLLSSGCL